MKDLTGATVTVFQRMNAEGDMLRVATNVPAGNGARALGTFIPRTNPDGTANPVLADVLRGETFFGSAFVVNAWYDSAYEPIEDDRGRIIGILYVGIRQQSVPSLREALTTTEVGDNGYVAVLGATSTRRGTWMVAPEGAEDGQDVSGLTDAEGRPWVQEVVDAAPALQAGQVGEVSFLDEEFGPSTARFLYYEPWDWVVTSVSRNGDYAATVDAVREGRRGMTQLLLLVGLLVAGGVGVASFVLAKRIADPLSRMASVAKRLAGGDTSGERVQHHSDDELGELAAAFAEMTDYQQEAARVAEGLARGDLSVRIAPKSEQDRMGQAFATMVDNLRATLETSARLSDDLRARSEHIARAAEQTSAEIEQTLAAMESAGALAGTTRERAAEGIATLDHVSSAMGSIVASIRDSGEVMTRLGEHSAKIDEIVRFISAITQQTNLLSLNATIEAARAGEAGKGFGVVASEVKQLAQESAESTERISALVDDIRASVEEAVQGIEVSRAQVSTGSETVDAAGQSFTSIRGAVEDLARQVEDVRGSSGRIAEAARVIGAQAAGLVEVAESRS